MNNRLPWDITAAGAGAGADADAGAGAGGAGAGADADAGADGGKTAPAAGAQVGRCLIVAMLLSAAALDLTRCGLVMTAARHPLPTAGVVTAGLVAAALTARTARGCQVGQGWAGWVALLIGAASAPQAAVSGFRSPYTIPDTATMALGILLAITILATAGRMGHRDAAPQIPGCWIGELRGDPERSEH